MGNKQSTFDTKDGNVGDIDGVAATPLPPTVSSYTRIASEELARQLLGQYLDLAGTTQGGRIVDVSDEFFASADNLLQSGPAVHRPNTYTDNGAWMDGWETRRHNHKHDWVIIKLGFAGNIIGFDIDTSYFNGNQAPAASVEACFIDEELLKQGGDVEFKWDSVLSQVSLGPNSRHFFMLDSATPAAYNFIRLRIYPDGGVARFRVYGTVQPVWPATFGKQLTDLAFIGNGGRVVAQSNQHYTASSNLILPGRGRNMGDGWETRRSRMPDHCDWIIVRLGAAGRLEKAEIDTNFFKGNFPEGVELDACYSALDDPSMDPDCAWFQVLPRQSLLPHQQHNVSLDLRDRVFTHVRMTIYPDGGVMRLRIYGRPVLAMNGEEVGNGHHESVTWSGTSTPVRALAVGQTGSDGGGSSGSSGRKRDVDERVTPSASSAAASARAAHRKRSRKERTSKSRDDDEYVDETAAAVTATTATATPAGTEAGADSDSTETPVPAKKEKRKYRRRTMPAMSTTSALESADSDCTPSSGIKRKALL